MIGIKLHVPVLLMTGSLEMRERLEAADCPHIPKPCRISALTAAADAALADADDTIRRVKDALVRVRTECRI